MLLSYWHKNVDVLYLKVLTCLTLKPCVCVHTATSID